MYTLAIQTWHASKCALAENSPQMFQLNKAKRVGPTLERPQFNTPHIFSKHSSKETSPKFLRTHTRTHKHKCTHVYTHQHTHTHLYTLTHTNTHTYRPYTHTPTHTHTHTYAH